MVGRNFLRQNFNYFTWIREESLGKRDDLLEQDKWKMSS